MKQKFILLFASLISCLLLSEITLSILIKHDLDNNLILNSLHIMPYRLPILETKAKLNKFKDARNSRLIPDPKLGWVPRPLSESSDNLYKYSNEGIRIDDIEKSFKEKKGLRIAIFGDSYSHGDEVKFEYSIGYFLEQLFDQTDLKVEVLNFAVSGYGLDQAYLRWQSVNDHFKPDIVILGVQFENVKRHINILRPFYSHITDIPYSKPRFILNNSNLKLFKNPITDVNKIVDVIKNFDDWESSKYEGFYNAENYKLDFWNYSTTYSTIKSLFHRVSAEFEFYNPASESYRITNELFNLFKYSVLKNHQIFIPVHLPTIDDLDFLYSTYLEYFHSNKFIYDELFEQLKSETKFVETFDKLEEWSLNNNVEQLFMKRHYSKVANEIIAKEIYNYMLEEHSQMLYN